MGMLESKKEGANKNLFAGFAGKDAKSEAEEDRDVPFEELDPQI